jgi:hypothetical protein
MFGAGSSAKDTAFMQLLHVDVLRGADSTGIAFISKKGKPQVIKEVGLPGNVMNNKQFLPLVRRHNIALLGHNRAATKGEVDKANAHPFVHPPIVGTHNGTLVSTFDLEDAKEFGTDSEAIFYNIALHGVDATYEKLNGAAGLAFWDMREKSLNLVTNGQRPIYFTMADKDSTVFYASEDWMLKGVLARCKIDHDKVYKLNPHYLFTFERAAGGVVHEARKLTERKTPVYNYNHPANKSFTPANRSSNGWQKDAADPGRPITSKWNTGKHHRGGTHLPVTGKDAFEAQKKREADRKAQQQAELDKVFKPTVKPQPKRAEAGLPRKGTQTLVPRKEALVKPEVEKFPDTTVAANGTIEWWDSKAGKMVVLPLIGPPVDDRYEGSNSFRSGPDGIVISEADFDLHYSECKGCGTALKFEDPDIDFVQRNIALCEECSETSRVSGIPANSIN